LSKEVLEEENGAFHTEFHTGGFIRFSERRWHLSRKMSLSKLPFEFRRHHPEHPAFRPAECPMLLVSESGGSDPTAWAKT
jgi:hypothetical protein